MLRDSGSGYRLMNAFYIWNAVVYGHDILLLYICLFLKTSGNIKYLSCN